MAFLGGYVETMSMNHTYHYQNFSLIGHRDPQFHGELNEIIESHLKKNKPIYDQSIRARKIVSIALTALAWILLVPIAVSIYKKATTGTFLYFKPKSVEDKLRQKIQPELKRVILLSQKGG